MTLRRRDVTSLLMLPVIVEHRSLNKAAQYLNTSQPALTRQIRTLETAVGAPIFVRLRRGVQLTPIGEILLAHAETVATELRQTASELSVIAEVGASSVRVGMPKHTAGFFIDTVIESFIHENANVSIRLNEDARPPLLEKLRLGDLDVVFAPSYELPEPNLLEHPILTIDYGVFANRTHPAARKRNLTLKDLIAYPWILPEPGGRFYRGISDEFGNSGLGMPVPTVQTSSMAIVRALLKKTELISVQGLPFVRPDVDSGDIRLLHGNWRFRKATISVFLQKQAKQSAMVQRFVQHVDKQARALKQGR